MGQIESEKTQSIKGHVVTYINVMDWKCSPVRTDSDPKWKDRVEDNGFSSDVPASPPEGLPQIQCTMTVKSFQVPCEIQGHSQGLTSVSLFNPGYP